RVVSAENYEAGLPLGIIYATSKNMLIDRVMALRRANLYEPQRYRHLIANIRLGAAAAEGIAAEANFLVVRTMQDGAMTVFAAGRYVDRIVQTGEGWKFARKDAVLDSRSVAGAGRRRLEDRYRGRAARQHDRRRARGQGAAGDRQDRARPDQYRARRAARRADRHLSRIYRQRRAVLPPGGRSGVEGREGRLCPGQGARRRAQPPRLAYPGAGQQYLGHRHPPRPRRVPAAPVPRRPRPLSRRRQAVQARRLGRIRRKPGGAAGVRGDLRVPPQGRAA